MTLLFRCLNPAQKFRITKHQIAKLLRIPESQIVKIESWLYIVFVHRLDRGGQFISYRQMEQWKNAIACQLQKCCTNQQLQHLWNAIEHDHIKHNQQYADSVLPFLKEICTKWQETTQNVSEKFNRAGIKSKISTSATFDHDRQLVKVSVRDRALTRQRE
jgi:hypothetical protein